MASATDALLPPPPPGDREISGHHDNCHPVVVTGLYCTNNHKHLITNLDTKKAGGYYSMCHSCRAAKSGTKPAAVGQPLSVFNSTDNYLEAS